MDQLTSDKQKIYNHPLYPLLAMLFDKCEMATTNIDKVMSTAEFNRDMDTFARDMERNRKTAVSGALGVITDKPELDAMMTNALQVMRIHLLELEKVNELCLDFCQRYVSCIKTKLSSHVLLKGDDSDSDDDFELAGLCAPSEPSHSDSASTSVHMSAGADSAPELSTSPSKLFYQMVQSSSGLPIQQNHSNAIAEPLNHSGDNSTIVQGSTPFSRIGGNHLPSALKSHEKAVAEWNKSGAKRGVLPKHATQIMKSWLFQHIVHPYPTEEEKKRLSTQTNLSILQVNNWFINARRRIIQPMLDGSSSGDPSKSRKNKPQVRQAQRFWPFPASERNRTGAAADREECEESASLDNIDVTHDDDLSEALISSVNKEQAEESSKPTEASGEINPI